MDSTNAVSRRRFVAGSGLGLAGLVGAATLKGSHGSSAAGVTGGGHATHAMKQDANPDLPANAGPEGWGGLAFIGGGEANKLWVCDAKQHQLVTSIDVGGEYVERTDPKRYPNLRDTHAMAFTKDFKAFFTVNSWEYGQSYAIKFDPLTLREIGRAPAGEGGHHCALSPDDKFLYVCNQYATTVSVIDPVTMTKITDIEVGSGADYITPSMYWDGTPINSPYMFVTCDKVPSVVAIDWKTNTVAKTIPASGANHGVNFTPDGKFVWVCTPGNGEFQIIDTTSLEIVKSFGLVEGGGPIHVHFSPDGKYAYASHISPDGLVLLKIDTATYEMVWNVPGSGAHLAVTPDGKEVWTNNHTFAQGERYPYLLGGQTLSSSRIFSAEDGTFLSEIVYERRPHEIQFVPYSALGVPEAPAEVTEVPVPEGARRITITVEQDIFKPAELTAKQNEVLQFEIVNKDSYDHIFGSGDPKVVLETVLIPGAKTTYVDYTVDVPAGTYKLVDGIHPGMEIQLTVE